jgi:hypothetical protein
LKRKTRPGWDLSGGLKVVINRATARRRATAPTTQERIILSRAEIHTQPLGIFFAISHRCDQNETSKQNIENNNKCCNLPIIGIAFNGRKENKKKNEKKEKSYS